MEIECNQLKQKEILSSHTVHVLREKIKSQYPNFSTSERALVFARCVYQLIDNNLKPFNAELQGQIKKDLLTHYIAQNNFDINAYDVLKTCVDLHLDDGASLQFLTNWFNAQQTTPLSEEEVSSLSQQLRLDTVPISTDFAELNAIPEDHDTTELPDTMSLTNIGQFVSIKTLMNLSLKAKSYLLVFMISLFSFISIYVFYQHQLLNWKQDEQFEVLSSKLPDIEMSMNLSGRAFPSGQVLSYKTIDSEALASWLKARHSLLGKEPYFSAIISAAKSNSINPLLLFAITGQEQSFVPENSEYALQIANNPFNVYGSWIQYNTSIGDSANIAAKTIVNLTSDCPTTADPILWLNQRYAEDPNWHLGVSFFLEELETITLME